MVLLYPCSDFRTFLFITFFFVISISVDILSPIHLASTKTVYVQRSNVKMTATRFFSQNDVIVPTNDVRPNINSRDSSDSRVS